jgi:cytochrome P450
MLMQARRQDPSIPAWSGDQLDSPFPPEIEAPYFDDHLRAWVLSRHEDILTAFHSSKLTPASLNREKDADESDESGRLRMRADTAQALSPARLRAWRDELNAESVSLAGRLPIGIPVDLMLAYARPLCLTLAVMVTGISKSVAETIYDQAEEVSAAAADPFDPRLRARAKAANTNLRNSFHSGPEPLRDSGFVALSQTMPCLLGNAWFALLQFPEQWALLHQQPQLMEQGMEELLRYAGPVRILTRRAIEDFELNGIPIHKGERIVLRIFASNRDPSRFSCPDELDILRSDTGHFTLGAGAHACVGAGLIRAAATAITHPLIQRFASMTPASHVEWKGGSVFRFPKSLWVRLALTETHADL